MGYLKGIVIATAMMLVANTSFAIDQQADSLGHSLEAELQALMSEIHDHHPNSHLDTDTHEALEAIEEFLEHVHHGDSHHELQRQLGPVRTSITHLHHTASRMGHWDYVRVGFFYRHIWHSDVHPHVQNELNHVVHAFNRLSNHLNPPHVWPGHGHGHHPHH